MELKSQPDKVIGVKFSWCFEENVYSTGILDRQISLNYTL